MPFWVWAVAGILALVLVVGVMFAIVRGGKDESTSTAGSGAAAQGGPEFEHTAQGSRQLVEAYFAAISQGRAEDAKAMLYSPGGNQELLTQAVLADPLKRAPITDVAVSDGTPGDHDAFSVPVSYKMGGKPVSTRLEVWKVQQGARIYEGTKTLSLSPFKGFDMTVNGMKVDGDSVMVFPGSYKIATATKYYEVDGADALLIKSPDDDSGAQQLYQLKPKANAEGIKMFREKVVSEAKKCLASKALKAGCGMELPGTVDGAKLTDGTVQRTMKAEERTKLEKVVPKPGTSVGTTLEASSYELGSVDITVDAQKDGRRGRSRIWGPSTGLGTATIDTTDPALPVVWDSNS